MNMVKEIVASQSHKLISIMAANRHEQMLILRGEVGDLQIRVENIDLAQTLFKSLVATLFVMLNRVAVAGGNRRRPMISGMRLVT